MKKFLVLYRMDMAEIQKMMASTSAEEKKKKGYGGVGGVDKKNMTSYADSCLLENKASRRKQYN